MEKLSDNLTISEVTKNNTAIKLGLKNDPTPEHLQNLKTLAEKIFEPLRKGLGNKPIYISCGYRGIEVNAHTRGASSTSYHCKGMALDLDADVFKGMTNRDIFNYIRHNLEYTELIWEYGNLNQPDWVHVAYDPKKLNKETLRCRLIDGKPKYSTYMESAL